MVACARIAGYGDLSCHLSSRAFAFPAGEGGPHLRWMRYACAREAVYADLSFHLSSRAKRGDLSFIINKIANTRLPHPLFRLLQLVVVRLRGFAMTKILSSRALLSLCPRSRIWRSLFLLVLVSAFCAHIGKAGHGNLPLLFLSPTPYHPSPITYHQPPITYHLPPTTYHLSPTTYHLSPTPYHLPPITYHLPPITDHLSPTTYHLPPTTYHLSPITYHPSPITYHLPPITHHLPYGIFQRTQRTVIWRKISYWHWAAAGSEASPTSE